MNGKRCFLTRSQLRSWLGLDGQDGGPASDHGETGGGGVRSIDIIWSVVHRVAWFLPNVLVIVVQWRTVTVGRDVTTCSSLNSRGVYHITRGVSGSDGNRLCS